MLLLHNNFDSVYSLIICLCDKVKDNRCNGFTVIFPSFS